MCLDANREIGALAADVSNRAAVGSGVRLVAKQIVGISVASLKASYSGRMLLRVLFAVIRYASLSIKRFMGFVMSKRECVRSIAASKRKQTARGRIETGPQANKLRRLWSGSEF